MSLILTDEKRRSVNDWTLEVVERHDHDGHELLNRLLTQIQQARKHGACRCVDCGIRKQTWLMFRCYYCGFYVCEECGADHFGEGREAWFEDGHCRKK